MIGAHILKWEFPVLPPFRLQPPPSPPPCCALPHLRLCHRLLQLNRQTIKNSKLILNLKRPKIRRILSGSQTGNVRTREVRTRTRSQSPSPGSNTKRYSKNRSSLSRGVIWSFRNVRALSLLPSLPLHPHCDPACLGLSWLYACITNSRECARRDEPNDPRPRPELPRLVDGTPGVRDGARRGHAHGRGAARIGHRAGTRHVVVFFRYELPSSSAFVLFLRLVSLPYRFILPTDI